MITRHQALDHYTQAYEVWLKKNPTLLDWLVHTASEVYDISPEDVRSGTDYNIQTAPAVHLQDIAVHRDTGKRGFDEVLSRHPHLEANRSRIEHLGEAVQFSLSSTAVRCAVREGRSIEALVPPGVAAIIQTQGLYR